MSARLCRKEWDVRPISLSTAQAMTAQHHYSKGGANTATYCHGLFRAGGFWEADCKGIAWWIPPTRGAAEATYPQRWEGVLALSRLVVLGEVPANGASFLLSRSMKLIDRSRWPCLVTYADTWRGHTGAIYKATNWDYVGITKPSAVWQLGGRMLARKAGGNTRTVDEMKSLGAVCIGSFPKHKFVHIYP